MISISISVAFFLINMFTYNVFDGLWFMFPMIPLGFILFLHYIFGIGKYQMESLAIRWEENEQGKDLGIKYIEELDDDFEGLELDSIESSILKKQILSRDDDFV